MDLKACSSSQVGDAFAAGGANQAVFGHQLAQLRREWLRASHAKIPGLQDWRPARKKQSDVKDKIVRG